MDAPHSPIRLLLVSRHTLTRSALVRLIADHKPFLVLADAGNRLQAVALAAQHAPDVIVFESTRKRTFGWMRSGRCWRQPARRRGCWC